MEPTVAGTKKAGWLRRASATLRFALAGMFVLAGYGKLSGAPEAVAIFDVVGLGDWFRYLTGVLELTGAGLLLVPRWSPAGALLLSVVMVGAIGSHLGPVGGSAAMPTALLILLLVVLALEVGRRPRSLVSGVLGLGRRSAAMQAPR